MNEPTFTYKRSGLSVTVYPDRLELVRGALWQPRRTKVIPMTSITAVSVEGWSAGKLRLETAGGVEELIVGRRAEEARQAIAVALGQDRRASSRGTDRC